MSTESCIQRLIEYSSDDKGGRIFIFSDRNISQTIIHISKNTTVGYEIVVREDYGNICNGLAYGTIWFSDGEVYVNGVLNGPLIDKYEAGFIIFPEQYVHLFSDSLTVKL
jgi:hypothetical protein